jgi:hypothetical protein
MYRRTEIIIFFCQMLSLIGFICFSKLYFWINRKFRRERYDDHRDVYMHLIKDNSKDFLEDRSLFFKLITLFFFSILINIQFSIRFKYQEHGYINIVTTVLSNLFWTVMIMKGTRYTEFFS